MNPMPSERIRNVLRKEWEVLFTDPGNALLITGLPFLIVAQGVLYVWLAYRFGGSEMLAAGVIQNALQKTLQAMPSVAQLTGTEQILVLLMHQFNFYLLLIPTVIAVSAATFSIVDEKQTGSLEALLATPVRTWELLLGKTLAGAIPALVLTWLSAGFFLLFSWAIGWGGYTAYVINAAWFLNLFLVTPAIAVLSFMLGVVGSSRAKDAKSAQNLILVIILPVLAFIAIQVTGIVLFTPLLTLTLGIALALVDWLMLRVAVRLFRRETILLQWR
jgi:ABC-2 type transport system permease protein